MTDELYAWSAVEIATAVATKKISSREVLESCLARTAEINPHVNALVDLMPDEARAAADEADAAVNGGDPLGPLHGVPVTIKINLDYKGRATTNGVAAFKNLLANKDNLAVGNLRKAGAIVFGRTNVPALSTRYFTDNDYYGRTLNPWNPKITPGGSSGGGAVAVATGMGALALGNDRAGSVRYPAYACGIAGLRPSLGRVADFNWTQVYDRAIGSQITHLQGPMARTVGDIRLMLKALAARDVRDPWWVPAPLEFGDEDTKKRIAMFDSIEGVDVDPQVQHSIQSAAKWLEDAGYLVERRVPPRFLEAAKIFWTLLMTEERAPSADPNATPRPIEKFADAAALNARLSTTPFAGQYDFDDYIRALARRTHILREWNEFFERYPLILMPVSWKMAFPIDEDQRGPEVMRKLLEAQEPLVAISILGLPGLSVPTDVVDGMPMGVQLVSARYQEELCLRAGEAIETRRTYPPLPIPAGPY
jgi:amidase